MRQVVALVFVLTAVILGLAFAEAPTVPDAAVTRRAEGLRIPTVPATPSVNAVPLVAESHVLPAPARPARP